MIALNQFPSALTERVAYSISATFKLQSNAVGRIYPYGLLRRAMVLVVSSYILLCRRSSDCFIVEGPIWRTNYLDFNPIVLQLSGSTAVAYEKREVLHALALTNES